GGKFARELLDVLHFEGEMRQIGTDNPQPAFIDFTNLDLFLALPSLDDHQLRAAPGSMTTSFLQTKNVFVKRHRLLQIFYSVTSVQKFFDHGLSYCPGRRIIQWPRGNLNHTIAANSLVL